MLLTLILLFYFNCLAFIGVSNNISQLLVSCVLSYYCTNGNRPRWMAIGIYIVSV